MVEEVKVCMGGEERVFRNFFKAKLKKLGKDPLAEKGESYVPLPEGAFGDADERKRKMEAQTAELEDPDS